MIWCIYFGSNVSLRSRNKCVSHLAKACNCAASWQNDLMHLLNRITDAFYVDITTNVCLHESLSILSYFVGKWKRALKKEFLIVILVLKFLNISIWDFRLSQQEPGLFSLDAVFFRMPPAINITELKQTMFTIFNYGNYFQDYYRNNIHKLLEIKASLSIYIKAFDNLV